MTWPVVNTHTRVKDRISLFIFPWCLYEERSRNVRWNFYCLCLVLFLINSSTTSIAYFLGEGSMSERREKRTLKRAHFYWAPTAPCVCHYERREKITNDDKCRYLLSSAANRKKGPVSTRSYVCGNTKTENNFFVVATLFGHLAAEISNGFKPPLLVVRVDQGSSTVSFSWLVSFLNGRNLDFSRSFGGRTLQGHIVSYYFVASSFSLILRTPVEY